MGRAIRSVQKDKVLRILDANQQTVESSTDLEVPEGDNLSPLSFSRSLTDLSTLDSKSLQKFFSCRGLANWFNS